MTWQDFAACKGSDPEVFFPARGDDARPAQAICSSCAVKAACLAYALDNGEHFGIWGGTSERERRRIRRRRLGRAA